jgi:long-chain-acyl-CoA dehydrogenase
VLPFHAKWEEEGQISRECWKQAGAAGLLGCATAEKYGGAGADHLYAAIVWEEQSYSGCTGPGFALHSDIVMPYIENYGTEAQKLKFLPKLASGEWIGAIAMTEPGAGSDLQGVKTSCIKKGDHYVLNGSKTYITNGAMADVIITVCKTDPTKGAKGISLAIVENGMAGFNRGRKLKKMGLKAQDTSELFFEDVKIPAENILGGEGRGFAMLMTELPQERLLIGDMALAASEAAFEWTRTFVKERKVFGKPVLDLQVNKHLMAALKTELTVGRAFMDNCLLLHNEKRLDTATASMSKYWATELQQRVIDECVQMHGGAGYMQEYPICRAYQDARVQRIYGGELRRVVLCWNPASASPPTHLPRPYPYHPHQVRMQS